MVLIVPFTRVVTDAATAAPFTVAAEIVTARPAGAACTEFAELAAAFPAQETQRRQPGRFVKPAFQDDVWAQAARFAREDDEHRLSDFLSVRGNPGVAKRGRINEVNMPLHQRGKGFFGALP